MTDSLTTYLHDHLAGANFAIEVLEFLREQRLSAALDENAEALHSEIEEDRNVLQAVVERAGAGAPVRSPVD